MVDQDRGVMQFFFNGQDLGPAFISEALTSSTLLPLMTTQTPCIVKVFEPSLYQWVKDIPEEPVPPFEIPPELEDSIASSTEET